MSGRSTGPAAAGVPLRVAVGLGGWHERFLEALEQERAVGRPLSFDLVNLGRDDWLSAVRDHDLILWKPHIMGPQAAAQFRAKIYFLERHCRKVVVPNFETVWHFENKTAQSYLFRRYGWPTPATFASFDYHDAAAELEHAHLPLVLKRPHGAGSREVGLLRGRGAGRRWLSREFSDQLWQEHEGRTGNRLSALLSAAVKPWFPFKVLRRLRGEETFRTVYWQEFIPGNESDLRITVVGDRYAFGFWRRNRPGDFRASGSGRIDYSRPVPEDALRLCLGCSRDLGFDSMAYDILFDGGEMKITEMSYGYLDTALHEAPGYHELLPDGRLVFAPGPVWVQSLWVRWALLRAARLPEPS